MSVCACLDTPRFGAKTGQGTCFPCASASWLDPRSRYREFHEALLDADDFEDLPGQWQAAIIKTEQSRPKLRVLSGD